MISRRVSRWVVALYFVAMTAAVTYPGIILFNRVRPFVLGIPFVFAWYLGWIGGALVVLALHHRAEPP